MENITVRIIKTPEFSSELYLDICYFLQSFPGAIEFLEDENLLSPDEVENAKKREAKSKEPKNVEERYDESEYYGPEYYDDDELCYTYRNLRRRGRQLSEEAQLLGFCSYYKEDHNISDDKLVVLLTSKKFSNELPAIYDSHNNIIIAVAEWDKYPEVDQLNPIVHLIIKTIVKCITNNVKEKKDEIIVDTTHEVKRTNKRITSHEVPKGCVNDKAENHFRVLLKLNNIEYCDGCANAMVEADIRNRIWLHGLEILQEVGKRSQGKNKKNKLRDDYPLESTIVLLKNGSSLTRRMN